MSNTTKKDEKELIKDVAAVDSALNSLSYAQLEEMLRAKKEYEIDKVTKELTAARGIVSALEAQLVNLGVPSDVFGAGTVSDIPVTRRGRKPNRFKMNGSAKPAKKVKPIKGKRGEVGAKIREQVIKAGKKGIHIKEIMAATGYKYANVTAFFNSKSGRKEFKNLGKATFTLAK